MQNGSNSMASRGEITPLQKFIMFIASGAFAGYSPFAPGTVGSLVGVLFFWLLPTSHSLWLAMISGGFIAGVFISTGGERIWGHDASRIVIDEIIGSWIALFLLPKTPLVIALSFLTFRAFDVIKPFPAGRSQRLPGGLGVMIDDAIAGVYANVVVQTIILFFG